MSALRAMAQGNNNGQDSEKLFNAPWQHYENGNQVSVGATLQAAEDRIRGNSFETGILVDSQGFVVAAYKGGAHSVSFGSEPADKFAGATVTHNHPSGYPTFSVADIATPAVYARLGGKPAGMRATTRDNGTFSLRTTRQDADWNRLATAYNRSKASIESAGYSAAARSTGRGSFRNAYIQAHADWFAQNAPRFGFSFTWER